MFSATMMASVPAVTIHSVLLTGKAFPPSTIRRAAMPLAHPIMKMTSPEISGGKNDLRRLNSFATTTSTAPANTVMPNSSGSPPALTASMDGPR
jgi:hypothetical protein